uniref:NADH dehydrogenase subunit 4L n=1 Tax=Hemiphaedusa aff. amoena RM-2016 TaxID=1885687 RepID=A0A347Z6D9_9EUPU|nr:NADH dehydrogenase subunit 4L [Hemiphaedusa aff. amoena RM-2016]
MYTLICLSMLMVFTSFLFFWIKNQYLSALLILEALNLLALLFFIYFSLLFCEGISVFLMVMTLSVCEGALGLTLLLSVVKIHGNDMFSTYSSLVQN